MGAGGCVGECPPEIDRPSADSADDDRESGMGDRLGASDGAVDCALGDLGRRPKRSRTRRCEGIFHNLNMRKHSDMPNGWRRDEDNSSSAFAQPHRLRPPHGLHDVEVGPQPMSSYIVQSSTMRGKSHIYEPTATETITHGAMIYP